MTEHIKVEDSFVDSILENASWDAAHITLFEKKDEKKDDKKADKKAKKDDKDDKDENDDKKAKKDDKDEKECPSDDDTATPSLEVAQESVEEHICPLCESVLEEALTDEQIQEHVAQITNALETIEEDDEDLDEEADVVKETSEKDANSPAESPGYKSRDQQSVEYHEREAKRREKSMAKVNKLKATAGGK